MNELLQQIAPLVGIIARECTTKQPDLYDDAVQEGMVRAWRVSEARPGSDRRYLTACARYAVYDVARGGRLTGAASKQGRPDLMDAGRTLSTDYLNSAGHTVDVADPRSGDPLAAAVLRDDVRQAVASLPPADRELVRLRFWEDRTFADCARILGGPKERLERRWCFHVRPALRVALAGLR